MRVKSLLGAVVFSLSVGIHAPCSMAASGEMGTGIPVFGLYGSFNNSAIGIWSLTNATIPFPAGCTNLVIYPATMGAVEHRMAYATLLTAAALQKPVRFYAHAARDGGCGIDYIQLNP